MKSIREYNEQELRKAVEGIRMAMVINANQPLVVEQMIKAHEQAMKRAAELGIEL